MAKIFGNGARIRRTNQQARVDALLADAERLLNDVFSSDSHYRFDRGRLYLLGQTALRQLASARLCNDPDLDTERRNPL